MSGGGDQSVFSVQRAAVVSALVILVALLGYFLAFGGFSRALRAIGFGTNLGPVAAGGNSESPVQMAARELGELKAAAMGAIQALGEPPPAEAIKQAEGVPQIDPWGKPYRYHRTPDGTKVWFSSDGPDMQPGTADDLETAKIP